MGKLPVGTIVAAYHTYGGESLFWKFYKIVGYTEKRVKFQELDDITTYDDGLDGPHYYNDPKHCQPKLDANGDYIPVGPVKTKNFKILSDGTFCFRPEEFYIAFDAWNGEPLETYNYH